VEHLLLPSASARFCACDAQIEAALGRIIAVSNQKGGVGKTTTVVNLGASLAGAKRHILIVDCDAQANSTGALGFSRNPARRSLYHGLVLEQPAAGLIVRTEVEGLDLLPADKNLAGAAVELINVQDREFRLKKFLAPLRDSYEYCLLDCPPSLDLMTLNALAASDSVLIPIQCEYLALEGVSELLDTLMRIRRTINPDLGIEGILLTMYDERTTLSKQVSSDLRSFFGEQVFKTVIPRNVRLAEAPSHGKPIIIYDIHSSGAAGYLQLAREMIANDQKRVGQGLERTDSRARTETGSRAS
jgi:chromosome partitioning protein